MRIVNRCIDDHKGSLTKQYGFSSNPDLPLWKNVETELGTMDLTEFNSRPRNAACHNLLRANAMPLGTPQLLGLGLNYCVKPTTTNKMTDGTFTRLTRDIRRMYALRGLADNGDGDYIPSLYLKSTYEFKKAPSHIEKAMESFKEGVLQKKCS